ncbi:MAG: hypothetical protein JW937_01080 [Candidatus Omnitrophica bacterium]|nr:hypothetical protein [Candidatus Omnitrophota bacterium]
MIKLALGSAGLGCLLFLVAWLLCRPNLPSPVEAGVPAAQATAGALVPRLSSGQEAKFDRVFDSWDRKAAYRSAAQSSMDPAERESLARRIQPPARQPAVEVQGAVPLPSRTERLLQVQSAAQLESMLAQECGGGPGSEIMEFIDSGDRLIY